MTEPQYRYGGPIPESVQRLKARRERRALNALSPEEFLCLRMRAARQAIPFMHAKQLPR